MVAESELQATTTRGRIAMSETERLDGPGLRVGC